MSHPLPPASGVSGSDTRARYAPTQPVGQYPRALWVRQAALEFHVSVGTIHNWIYSPDSAFQRVAGLVRHMVAGGQAELADRQCAVIDRARYPEVVPLPLGALEVIEQEADGAQDVAQTTFLCLPESERPRAWKLRRRAILKHLSTLTRQLDAGDREYAT